MLDARQLKACYRSNS